MGSREIIISSLTQSTSRHNIFLRLAWMLLFRNQTSIYEYNKKLKLIFFSHSKLKQLAAPCSWHEWNSICCRRQHWCVFLFHNKLSELRLCLLWHFEFPEKGWKTCFFKKTYWCTWQHPHEDEVIVHLCQYHNLSGLTLQQWTHVQIHTFYIYWF